MWEVAMVHTRKVGGSLLRIAGTGGWFSAAHRSGKEFAFHCRELAEELVAHLRKKGWPAYVRPVGPVLVARV